MRYLRHIIEMQPTDRPKPTGLAVMEGAPGGPITVSNAASSARGNEGGLPSSCPPKVRADV